MKDIKKTDRQMSLEDIDEAMSIIRDYLVEASNNKQVANITFERGMRTVPDHLTGYDFMQCHQPDGSLEIHITVHPLPTSKLDKMYRVAIRQGQKHKRKDRRKQ